MRKLRTWGWVIAVVIFAGFLIGRARETSNRDALPKAKELRVGYLGNVTHAQALIGLERGDFQEAVGREVAVKPKVFHSGTLVVEALFAREIDLAYLGPSPAINGFIRSQKKAFQIVAGAASGGVALVVRRELGIRDPKELAGKIIAVPGISNSQDVSCRHYFEKTLGFKLKEQGGATFVAPVAGSDMLFLFKKKEIDAAWFPEPWVSRLAMEASGDIILKEKDLWPNGIFPTTVLIATKRLLGENPALVKRWLSAHADLTLELQRDKESLGEWVQAALARIMSRELPLATVRQALADLDFTIDPATQGLQSFMERAVALGYLPEGSSMDGLVDVSLLNEVRSEKGRPIIRG